VSSSPSLAERPALTRELPQRGSRSQIALAVILTCQLMLVLDGTVVNIALPKIQETLHFSASNLSWVLNAYMLAFGGLLLLGGRAGDMFGRRRLFIAGIAVFTVASLLGGFATSGTWLIAARAAQGIGAALAAPSALALIATSFPEGPQRNRALSYFTAVSSAGGSLGLILGGLLTSGISWRWVLFINVPIGIAVVVLAPMFVDEPKRQHGHLDIAGALTSTAGMVSLVYGFIRASTSGWSDRSTVGALTLGVVILALFVAIEARAGQPIMPLRLFLDRNRASAYLSVLLTVATMFGVFFFLSQFLQLVLGFSPVGAGLAFLPLTLLIFAASQVVPRLIPRFGPRRIRLFGAALITGATLWLTQLSATSSYALGILGPLLLFGLGVGCTFLPLSIIVLSGVRREDAGAASGLLQTMQQVGGSLGLGILVTAFGTATRSVSRRLLVGATPQAQAHIVLAHGIGSAFVVSLIFAAASLAIGLFALRAAPAPARQPADEAEREAGVVAVEM
jgi:EmrB/QacA subfamily drug resistance transporter